MKIASLLAFAILATGSACGLFAEEKNDHEHIKAGPTGGRLITKVEPHAEFFVTKDRKVEIRFVDDDNKVVAPGKQTVTVTMGDRSAPTKLAFAKEGDKLVSDQAIPEGNRLPTVVQIKTSLVSKTISEKFTLDLSKCPECKNGEYACICDHHHN